MFADIVKLSGVAFHLAQSNGGLLVPYLTKKNGHGPFLFFGFCNDFSFIQTCLFCLIVLHGVKFAVLPVYFLCQQSFMLLIWDKILCIIYECFTCA